jgi:hypothetical protein
MSLSGSPLPTILPSSRATRRHSVDRRRLSAIHRRPGYSIGRLLRERYHFAGELRAIGDVQRDQLYYLSQCGFNAFSIRSDRSAEDALAGLTAFSDGYQSTTLRTPWFRRHAAVGAQ